MDIFSLNTVAQLLAEQWTETKTENISAQTGDIFTTWQLCWLMHTCHIQLPARTLERIDAFIRNDKPQEPLPVIQNQWMRARGLLDDRALLNSANFRIFFETLKGFSTGQSGANASSETLEDLIFQTLKLTAGVTSTHQADIFALIQESKSQTLRSKLTLVSSSTTDEWLSVDTVATLVEKKFPQNFAAAARKVVIVPLPPPLQTPMSWSMRTDGQSNKRLICLGWPTGSHTFLHVAEQHALLAHEMCHLQQLAGDSEKNQNHTVLEREFQALRSEWDELQNQCYDLSKNEANDLAKRWWNANYVQQLKNLKEDIELFESILQKPHHDAPVRRWSVQLPFMTLVYALCARMVQPQGLEPRTPAV